MKAQTLPTIFRAAFADGETLFREIEETAGRLSHLLVQAHGGEWNARINHERGIVMIVRVIEGDAS